MVFSLELGHVESCSPGASGAPTLCVQGTKKAERPSARSAPHSSIPTSSSAAPMAVQRPNRNAS